MAEHRQNTDDPKRTISGPGAADFLTSPSGEDLPGFSANKGMGATREAGERTDPRNLVPRLGPDTEAEPGERKPDDDRSDDTSVTRDR